MILRIAILILLTAASLLAQRDVFASNCEGNEISQPYVTSSKARSNSVGSDRHLLGSVVAARTNLTRTVTCSPVTVSSRREESCRMIN